MPDIQNDILELKFEGGEINPENVKASEIANLIANFERVLLHQIKQDEPAVDIDEILFTFDQIDNKSLDLIFKTKQLKEILVSSYIVVASSFTTGDYSKVSKSSIAPLKEIVKFSKKHNCIGVFNLNNEKIGSFEPSVEIKYELQNTIQGDTTIYGKIIRIGGEEPRIHFRISEEEKLIFEVDEDLAKKLSPKLYDFIGLTGTATWNIHNYAIENFVINSIIELDKKPITEAFNEIKGVIGKYWDEIEDVENYLN